MKGPINLGIFLLIGGAVKKFPEMWFSTVMVGHDIAYLITFKL